MPQRTNLRAGPALRSTDAVLPLRMRAMGPLFESPTMVAPARVERSIRIHGSHEPCITAWKHRGYSPSSAGRVERDNGNMGRVRATTFGCPNLISPGHAKACPYGRDRPGGQLAAGRLAADARPVQDPNPNSGPALAERSERVVAPPDRQQIARGARSTGSCTHLTWTFRGRDE